MRRKSAIILVISLAACLLTSCGLKDKVAAVLDDAAEAAASSSSGSEVVEEGDSESSETEEPLYWGSETGESTESDVSADLSEEEYLIPTKIEASSELAAYSSYTYYAANVADGFLNTAWNEGADGTGVGEYLEFYFPEGTEIDGGIVYPGYYKNKKIFNQNYAPTILEFSSGGETRTLDTSAAAEKYSKKFKGQEFTFDEPLISDGVVRVTVQAVREGSKYDDCAISELHFTGKEE